MEEKKHHDVLFPIICAAFCVVVVISNIISSKFIMLPFFVDFAIPAGLITYPLTFLLSDLATELYGSKKAKHMVYTALGMTVLGYVIIKIALILPSANNEQQQAFDAVLGLNGLIITASLTAFAIAQVMDIQIYASIRKLTGDKYLWLRNNGSTLPSQIADTIAVNLIHLWYGLGMELGVVISIMIFSYSYKAIFSIMYTPLFYLCVWLAKRKNNNNTAELSHESSL